MTMMIIKVMIMVMITDDYGIHLLKVQLLVK